MASKIFLFGMLFLLFMIVLSYMTLSKRISAINPSTAAAATTTDYTIQPTVTGGTLVKGTSSITPLSDKITMLTYNVQMQPTSGATKLTCVIKQPNDQVYSTLRNVVIEGSSANGNVDIYNIAYQSNLTAKTLTINCTVNDTTIHKLDAILFLN